MPVEPTTTLLQGTAVLGFGVGAVSALADLARPTARVGWTAWLGVACCAAGLVATVSALMLSAGSRSDDARLWVATADEALLALAAGTAFVFLWMSPDPRFRSSDAVFLPALTVIVLASVALRIFGGSEARIGPGALMAAHMLTVTAAATAYTTGCVGGLLYLAQANRLASKSAAPGLMGRLPALETLEHFNYRAAAVGFPVLTIGVVTGFAVFGTADRLAAGPTAWVKIGLALLAWIGYGVLVLLVPRFRARLVAQLNIAGFVVLLAVLLVARFSFT